jgi:hypothetical protein
VNSVISEQGSALAYAVTEGSETGKSNDFCGSWIALRFQVKNQMNSRTQI